MALDLSQDPMPLIVRSSLQLVSKSHTLRCDAKQAERRFEVLDEYLSSISTFLLDDCLPYAFAKGPSWTYVDYSLDLGQDEIVPVINTLAIQDKKINIAHCRYVTTEDYDNCSDARKPRPGDVLLTMDGGTSIGKPAVFHPDEPFGIDSHVAILRPEGIDPHYLVYLLDSKLGQIQFERAESGASGQTAVTEDDVRRFRFPVVTDEEVETIVSEHRERLKTIRDMEQRIIDEKEKAEADFLTRLVENAQPTEKDH